MQLPSLPMSSDALNSGDELRLFPDMETPREEWPDAYRRVVEHFEENRDLESFEAGGSYPSEYDPYVLHEEVKAPLRPDADKEYSWYVLLNPWGGSKREAWIIDGEPLRASETAHGASDGDIVATDRDITDVFSRRVVVCVALEKVAEFHSRGSTWLHSDDAIHQQFEETVLPALNEEE